MKEVGKDKMTDTTYSRIDRMTLPQLEEALKALEDAMDVLGVEDIDIAPILDPLYARCHTYRVRVEQLKAIYKERLVDIPAL